MDNKSTRLDDASWLELLRARLLEQPAAPEKKVLTLTRHNGTPRQVCWYHPAPPEALDAMLRSACGVPPGQPYLLTDGLCAPIAFTSSLPSGESLELVLLPSVSLGSPPGAVVVVDPISTGIVLAHQIATRRGLQVVCVWSDVLPEELKNFVAKGYNVDFAARIEHETGGVEATASAVRALGLDVREVMVGCETGVLLGDELSVALCVRTNGTAQSSLRRNKFLQTEAIRDAGLNACGQALATCEADVEAFLAAKPKGPFKAVVKPVEGAGSDGVSICNSPDEVRAAYGALQGSKNVLGITNYDVLLQEYLRGDEYVVDTVSRSGVHKCVAIWKYDKRKFNNAPVVYYGMRLLPIDAEPELQAMVDYVLSVLDTLSIKNGCMHSEIKLEERGPVLIEVNCRIHGGEGTWAPMAEACLGYSAVSAMLDAHLDAAAFAALPFVPTDFRAHAMEAKLRSAVSGTLTAIDAVALRTIRALPSYKGEMLAVAVGKQIDKTVDAVSACGNINLVNSDIAALQEDYAKLHSIVERGIFTVRPGSGEDDEPTGGPGSP